MTKTDTHATIDELLEELFPVRSVPILYNELPLQDSLQTAVRRIRSWCQMAASLGVSSETVASR
jgi:hypothetical protein